MSWQNIGLMIYCIVTIGAVLILMGDWLALERQGLPTISDYSRANPWLAYVILVLIASGNAGLAVHFMSNVVR